MLIAVGVLAFAVFIVLSAFAADLRPPEGPGEHAQSKSAVGFAGVVELLRASGRTVQLHKGPVREVARNDLLVLTPPLGQKFSMGGPPASHRSLDQSLLRDLGTDTLIILPKWFFGPSERAVGWVSKGPIAPNSAVEGVLQELRLDLHVLHDVRSDRVELTPTDDAPYDMRNLKSPRIESLQYLESEDLSPALVDAQGRMILGFVEFGNDSQRLYILSDPDLLNTQGLADRDTAETGYRILAGLGPTRDGAVVFDLTLHGVERSRNLLKLMLEPPFLPATLCLVFAGVLIGLHAATRRRIPQGPKPGLAPGGRVLVENSALLVTQAGKELGMGRRYAAMTRALAMTRVGGARGLGEAQQIEILNGIARSRGMESFSKVVETAQTATRVEDMMTAVGNLFRWRQELGRER